MNPITTCKKCGKESLTSHRYCDMCGEPLFIDLDSKNLQNEDFIEIYNSVYSVISNKANMQRNKYIEDSIESILFNRPRTIFEELWKNVIMMRSSFKGMDDPFNKNIQPAIQNIVTHCSSTILSGYAYRVAEELYTKKKNINVDQSLLNEVIAEYIENTENENVQLKENKREMLCNALTSSKKFYSFILMARDTFDIWFQNLVWDWVEHYFELYLDYLRILFRSSKKEKVIDEDQKQRMVLEVSYDFAYGYCLRLSLSLM